MLSTTLRLEKFFVTLFGDTFPIYMQQWWLTPLMQIVFHIRRSLRLGHKCRCKNKQTNFETHLESFMHHQRENFVELHVLNGKCQSNDEHRGQGSYFINIGMKIRVIFIDCNFYPN